jgi:nucleotide-binding universal stress UspA family protein
MQTILVPIDFSENALNALEYATGLVTGKDMRLVLLNVYTGDVSNYDAGWPSQELFEAIKPEREERLRELIASGNISNAVARVEEGDAIEKILSVAADTAADVILMGTHGVTGLKQVLFGSNTSGIIARSSVPVWAIPQEFKFSTIEKFIYAADFKHLSTELDILIPFAAALKCSIEILHLNYGLEKNENIHQQFEEVLNKSEFKNMVLENKSVSLEEPLVDYLKYYTKGEQHAVLAMFTEDRSWLDKILLSSKTEEIAGDLNLPLLTFRKIQQ